MPQPSACDHNLAGYYARRAAEYEAVYHKPERQADLEVISRELQGVFSGKTVLEIACGTGYWTERIAATAASVLATDINHSMLDLARQKSYDRRKVAFRRDDFWDSRLDQRFEALFGGFIWSHIPLERLPDFLDRVESRLLPGGTALFLDNRFVAGSSLPISQGDPAGNTFQERRLADGTTFSILKNFPEETFLRTTLSGRSPAVTFVQWPYYWLAGFRSGPGRPEL
jgi:SAM-dependent methyltransferase